MHFGEPFGGLLPGARGAVLAALLRTGTSLTGRQLHALVSDQHSLWSVQEALKALAQVGVVESRTIGRAGVHAINEDHASVPPLRALVDPITVLTTVIEEATDSRVKTVLLFGSIARGEPRPDSDIDLAVIATADWDGRVALEDHVRTRIGNSCDALVLTPAEFDRLARTGEPVVTDILHEGVALVGSKPRIRQEAT